MNIVHSEFTKKCFGAGYEVHCPAPDCPALLSLLQAGLGRAELPWAGAEAMESLALEAGYRHWPADISQVYT